MTPPARSLAEVSLLVCAICGLASCDKPTVPRRNDVAAQNRIEAPSTPDREHVRGAAPAGESPRSTSVARIPGKETINADLGPPSDNSSARESLGEAKLNEDGGRDLGAFSIQNGTGDQLKTLAAVDGEVRLLRAQVRGTQGGDSGQPKKYPYRAESYAWKITRTAQGCAMQAMGKGMKHHGWYLSCDREMPAKGVFLAERPTAGSYWKIDHVSALTEDRATPLRAGIAGADWTLDFDPDGETYIRDVATGYVTVYQLTLVQGRGERWVIDFFGK